MPIFKIVAKEEIVRETVAYVEAPNLDAAERWGSMADDNLFRVTCERESWAEIEKVEAVDAAPDGWRVRTAVS